MPLSFPDSGVLPWTPVFTAATPPTDVTYGSQLGRYVRQGSLVFYEFIIVLTSKGTGGVGNVDITGLPYPARAQNMGAGGGLRCTLLDFPAGYTAASPRVVQSDSKIQIALYGDNITQLFATWANFADTSTLTVGGFYMI